MTEFALELERVERETPPSTRKTSSLGVFLSLELRETIFARWYWLYVAGFAGLMGLFFAFGLAESQVMGFHGLGRILLTFVQVTLVVLPLFIFVTTARSLVGDREAGVWEYLLALPVDFLGYYWGRFIGRCLAIVAPLVGALVVGAAAHAVAGGAVPWALVFFYAGIVGALSLFCLGVAMLISVASGGQEMALGTAFAVWLAIEALVDALLLGLLIRQRVPADWVLGAAMLNPLQSFRTASVSLFDPELSVLGPLSYTLLDVLGRPGLLVWALAWPTIAGLVCAACGYYVFRSRDVV